LAIGASVLSVAALQHARPEQQTAGASASVPWPERTDPPIPVRTQLNDVLPRLRDTARPFNVVVFSDSTGAGRETWTALTGEWLGEKYNRTVEGVQWDIHEEPNGYRGSKWHLAEGEGAVVNWWNGASAGKDAVYSLANIDAIAPIPGESVDLVFVSHGHNHSNRELVPEVASLVTEASARYPNAAVVLVMQNPEASTSAHQLTQQREVQALGRYAYFQGYPNIDVYTPFSEQDVDALIDDTLYHPTEEGYRFWADQVTAVLDAND
jgi:hypothetical protein